MIDISTEHLIPIRDVPRHLPSRPTGRRVHVSAVYRWIQRGVRGVRLEAIRIGGSTYTSTEALQRFADSLGKPSLAEAPCHVQTTASRQKRIAMAANAVGSILGGGGERASHGTPPMDR